jgi:hypothetical protein
MASDGTNTGSCSVDITIDDNTNPTANCPDNITQNQTAGQCGANVNFTIPAATDNCSVMSTSANPASGSFFAVGTTQVTVTAMDASGNTGTCTFDVTINDTENPTANCPGTQTVGILQDSVAQTSASPFLPQRIIVPLRHLQAPLPVLSSM